MTAPLEKEGDRWTPHTRSASSAAPAKTSSGVTQILRSSHTATSCTVTGCDAVSETWPRPREPCGAPAVIATRPPICQINIASAFQSILSLAQLSGSSSVQENVWGRREAHEECFDVRSVGEDLHGEHVVRGEQLQLIVHRPLRRIGLRQVIDCTEKNWAVSETGKELARKRGRVAHSRRRRSSWLGCCCSPARTPPTHRWS